jgi:hypothetical protein
VSYAEELGEQSMPTERDEEQLQEQMRASARDRAMEELGKGYPETFMFANEGDTIIGIFKRVEKGPTQFGPRAIVVLEEVDEVGDELIGTGVERSVWLMHTVLFNQFDRLRPKPGELVGIRRLADQVQKGGRVAGRSAYKNFVVKRLGGDERSDGGWDLLDSVNPDPTQVQQQQGTSWEEAPPPTDEDADIPF